MQESKSFDTNRLYKLQRYDEVIKLYENVERGYIFNEWDYYYYLNALKKMERYREGLKLSFEVLKRNPQYKRVQDIYCWFIYYEYIRNFHYQNGNEGDFFKAVDFIVKFAENNEYTPYRYSLWKAVDYLESKASINYEKINYYISLLSPNILSAEPKKLMKDNKEMKLASEREKWYSIKSKALLKNGQYEECIRISQEALRTFKELHHDNNIWFNYRIAVSKIELGDLDRAEEILVNLLKEKEQWFLYESMFKIYIKKNDFDKALKFAASAALSFGEHKHKLKLYEEISDFISQKGMEKEAYYHLLLIKKVREENDWKISNEFLAKLYKYNEEELNKTSLIRYLEAFWRQYKFKGETKLKGVINKILPNGKAGFIQGENGQRYYFRMNSICNRKMSVEEGKEVTFYTKESFDRVKHRVSMEAIEIVICK